MIEMLMAMMILSLFYPLMLSCAQLLIRIDRFPAEVQDQIGLAQLRRFLNGCPVESVSDDKLICINHKMWSLQVSDHHLYLSDGTVIVLEGVNQIYFEQCDSLIWLHYVRNGQWKKALIAYV